MMVMIPFWTSFLIRTYAWVTILKSEGLLNGLLLQYGLILQPFEMLYTPGAVILGLVYTFLPFMILPIYTSVEKLDNALVEAAFDLGAGPVRAFSRVIVPMTSPGIAAGVLLVFIPALGLYAVNDMLGGGKVDMIGNVIENQFKGNARNWPFGSALGITLLLAFGVAFWFTGRRRQDASSRRRRRTTRSARRTVVLASPRLGIAPRGRSCVARRCCAGFALRWRCRGEHCLYGGIVAPGEADRGAGRLAEYAGRRRARPVACETVRRRCRAAPGAASWQHPRHVALRTRSSRGSGPALVRCRDDQHANVQARPQVELAAPFW